MEMSVASEFFLRYNILFISLQAGRAQKSGIKACEPSQPKQDKIPVSNRAQELATTTVEAPSTNRSLESWVYQQFFDIGFKAKSGFIGYKKLQKKLHALNPQRGGEISIIIQR
jgi:hypothetical protein